MICSPDDGWTQDVKSRSTITPFDNCLFRALSLCMKESLFMVLQSSS